MADTGAPWNLRYPLPTDLVKDGADNFKDLADDVASFLTKGIGPNVVTGTTTTSVAVSSTTFVDITGLTATITPTLTSSKVLVLVSCQVDVNTNSTASIDADIRIVRGATTLETWNHFAAKGRGDVEVRFTGFAAYLDSPNTTSATTYQVQGNSSTGTSTYNRNGARSTIVLIEVAG